ncbi:Uncharacterised protein [Vibrio cholerae]|nr:Uncharacterised protein [Vibrio cholerae]CSC87564.1 Uncharacterised protein [Vibrio cholerae]CSI04426.1 Uncharacterised protein [Vibrio cholerae]
MTDHRSIDQAEQWNGNVRQDHRQRDRQHLAMHIRLFQRLQNQ